MRYLPKQPYVRPLGRVIEHEDKLCLGYSCSGVTFTFTGTVAAVTLYTNFADRPAGERGFASYLGVYDETGAELCRISPREEESRFVIYESDTPRTVTLTVCKITEEHVSLVAITGIETDGEPSAPPAKERRIEVLGDSITCGYGIEHPQDAPGGYHTEYQNAYEAWGGRIARMFDAELSIMARSGSGVYSSYSGNGQRQTGDLACNLYRNRAPQWNNRLKLALTRDDSYDPHVVLVNWGTNDDSYTGNDPEKLAAFGESYYQLIEMLRSYNPNAHLFFTIGGTWRMNPWPEIQKQVAAYTANTGDTRVHAFLMHAKEIIFDEDVNPSCHPPLASHKRMAAIAAKEIAAVMGWEIHDAD